MSSRVRRQRPINCRLPRGDWPMYSLVQRDEQARGGGPLGRWSRDRDHYVRKPLAWYVSPAWRRESGL